MKNRSIGIALLAVSILAGCSSDDTPEYVERPVEELYNEAADQAEGKDFAEAADTFLEVERQHPYSIWATKAQLMSSFSYYSDGQYDDAILSADRFIQLHPGNRDISYAYYLKAQKVRTRIAEDFRQAFETVDVLLTPTAPSEAFVAGSKSDDPIAMYLNDVFTVPGSMAGLPGISVPAGNAANGLPLGLQILAKPFDEQTLFRAAHVLEMAAGVTARPTQWWKEAGA